MVQFLEREPTALEIVSGKLGQGISSGLAQLVSQRSAREKARSDVLNTLPKRLKAYSPETLADFQAHPENYRKMELLSQALVDRGLSADEAPSVALQLFKQHEQNQKVAAEQKKQVAEVKKLGTVKALNQGMQQSFLGKSFAPLVNMVTTGKATPSDIQEAIDSNPTAWEGFAKQVGANIVDLPFMIPLIKNYGPSGGFALWSAISSAWDKITEGAKEGIIDLPGYTPGSSIFKGGEIFTKEGLKKNFGNLYNPKMAEKGKEVIKNTGIGATVGAALKAVHQAVPGLDEAFKKIPGLEKNFRAWGLAKTVAQAGEVAAVSALPSLLQGQMPTSQDFQHGLALVSAFSLPETIPALQSKLVSARNRYAGIKPEVPSAQPQGPVTHEKAKAVPDIFGPEALSGQATPSAEPPQGPSPASQGRANLFDKALGSLNKSEQEAVAKAKSPEAVNKIIDHAAKRLREAEVKPEKEAGKAGEVAKRTPAPEFRQPTEERRTASPKEKERLKGLERVVESPLEKYYEREREVKHREETVKKMELQETELKARENRIKEDLLIERNKYDKIVRDMEQANGHDTKARIDSLRRRQLEKLQRMNEELNDINRIRKYGRPAPKPAELEESIQKSFKEIQESIKNPPTDAKELAKIARRIEAAQKDLALHEKLSKRGELPKVSYEDTYVKVEKAYADAYKDMISKLKDMIQNETNDAKLSELKQFKDVLEKRLKHNQVKTANQLDRIRAKHMLRGAKGAFNKNLLKAARTDIEEFKKDFFRQQKLEKPMPSTEVALKKISELGKRFAEHPTAENAAKVEEATGVKSEDMKVIKEEANSALEKSVEAAKDPTPAKEAAADKSWKDLLKKYKDLSRKYKKVNPAIRIPLNALIGGTLSFLWDNIFTKDVQEDLGGKPSVSILAAILPAGIVGRGVGLALGGSVKNKLNNLYEKKLASDIRKLPTSEERIRRLQEIKKKYGPAKAKRIHKFAYSP